MPAFPRNSHSNCHEVVPEIFPRNPPLEGEVRSRGGMAVWVRIGSGEGLNDGKMVKNVRKSGTSIVMQMSRTTLARSESSP